MERRVRETLLGLGANVIAWGAAVVGFVWLCACEYGPDTLDMAYSQGMGTASADGFEAESDNQAWTVGIGWFLKAREFKLVGHELDANRDAIPVFPTNTPPVVLHDHPEAGDSLIDQAGGLIDKADKADVNTLLFIISILALILGVGALGGAIYILIKRRANGRVTQ